MTKTIGIVLFDGVEELDAVGPWEVLAAWAIVLARRRLAGGHARATAPRSARRRAW